MKSKLFTSLMLMFACISMMAQSPIKVTGTVTDNAGASVIAASVVEQGNTSNGVVWDFLIFPSSAMVKTDCCAAAMFRSSPSRIFFPM